MEMASKDSLVSHWTFLPKRESPRNTLARSRREAASNPGKGTDCNAESWRQQRLELFQRRCHTWRNLPELHFLWSGDYGGDDGAVGKTMHHTTSSTTMVQHGGAVGGKKFRRQFFFIVPARGGVSRGQQRPTKKGIMKQTFQRRTHALTILDAWHVGRSQSSSFFRPTAFCAAKGRWIAKCKTVPRKFPHVVGRQVVSRQEGATKKCWKKFGIVFSSSCSAKLSFVRSFVSCTLLAAGITFPEQKCCYIFFSTRCGSLRQNLIQRHCFFAFLHEQPLLPSNKHNPDHQSEHWVNLDKAVSSGCKVEDPYPFQSRQESATQAQQPNGFFDSYFVSYTAAKIAGWGAPAGPYHPGPPHMSHHPVSGMKDGPPGYPPHPQLMDMYSGVSPATAINTMDWKNTSQVGLHHFI